MYMLIKIGSFSFNITMDIIKSVLLIVFISSIILFHIGIPCITMEGFEMLEDGLNDLEKETGKFVNKFKKSEMFVNPKTSNDVNSGLFYLTKNKFSPDCCDYSTISTSNGCACITKEQEDFLNSRGNNRTAPKIY